MSVALVRISDIWTWLHITTDLQCIQVRDVTTSTAQM